MRRSNHENIDVLMLIGLVTEGGEGEGEGGKSHSKVGTRWVRQPVDKYDTREYPRPLDVHILYTSL